MSPINDNDQKSQFAAESEQTSENSSVVEEFATSNMSHNDLLFREHIDNLPENTAQRLSLAMFMRPEITRAEALNNFRAYALIQLEEHRVWDTFFLQIEQFKNTISPALYTNIQLNVQTLITYSKKHWNDPDALKRTAALQGIPDDILIGLLNTHEHICLDLQQEVEKRWEIEKGPIEEAVVDLAKQLGIPETNVRERMSKIHVQYCDYLLEPNTSAFINEGLKSVESGIFSRAQQIVKNPFAVFIADSNKSMWRGDFVHEVVHIVLQGRAYVIREDNGGDKHFELIKSGINLKNSYTNGVTVLNEAITSVFEYYIENRLNGSIRDFGISTVYDFLNYNKFNHAYHTHVKVLETFIKLGIPFNYLAKYYTWQVPRHQSEQDNPYKKLINKCLDRFGLTFNQTVKLLRVSKSDNSFARGFLSSLSELTKYGEAEYNNFLKTLGVDKKEFIRFNRGIIAAQNNLDFYLLDKKDPEKAWKIMQAMNTEFMLEEYKPLTTTEDVYKLFNGNFGSVYTFRDWMQVIRMWNTIESHKEVSYLLGVHNFDAFLAMFTEKDPSSFRSYKLNPLGDQALLEDIEEFATFCTTSGNRNIANLLISLDKRLEALESLKERGLDFLRKYAKNNKLPPFPKVPTLPKGMFTTLSWWKKFRIVLHNPSKTMNDVIRYIEQ